MSQHTESIPAGAIPAVPTPLVALVVDDESSIRGPLALYLEALGHTVVEAASAEEAVQAAARQRIDVTFLDVRLGTVSGLDLIARLLAGNPRMKIIVITAYASVDVALRAMARGAAEFLCKPFTPDQVAASLSRVSDLRAIEASVGIAVDRTGTAGPEADFATTSQSQQEAVSLARSVAPGPVPVLLTGEAGTGKRILGRAIHGWGSRPEGPICVLDCLAKSSAFTDVMLFGDALVGDQVVMAQRTALVEQAHGGTLIISHINAMSSASQIRLARLIERREFEPHQAAPRKCDVRIVATLEDPVQTPLHPPLHVLLERVRIHLPPLRERPDDIPMLAQRYLAQARQNSGKTILGFSVGALDVLSYYPWPGNLTELRAVASRVVEIGDTPFVEERHLPPHLHTHARNHRRPPRAGDSVTLEELEKAHITAILASSASLQEAADRLGIDLQALYRRRKQYGLIE
jgi:NtrC-family two-component system response regulator AlgB